MDNKATLVTLVEDTALKQDIIILEYSDVDAGVEVRFNTTESSAIHKIVFDDTEFTIFEGWWDMDATELLASDKKVNITNKTKELGSEEPINENIETILEVSDTDIRGLIEAVDDLGKVMTRNSDRLIKAIQGINPNV